MKPCNHCAKRHPTYVTCKQHEQAQNKEHVKPPKPDENESQLEKPLPENPETVNTSKDHASFKERERAAVNKWRSNNRAKYNAYMREYRRKRRKARGPDGP